MGERDRQTRSSTRRDKQVRQTDIRVRERGVGDRQKDKVIYTLRQTGETDK